MQRWLAVLLLVASVGIHWPAGPTAFTFDDDDFILTNQSLRTLPDALAAFDQPFPPAQVVRGLYRPLTNFSYALDHARAGQSADAFHRSNVLFYLVVVLLVFWLARWYTPSLWLAFTAALLFSLHPVHCDAVDSISGRSEVLALLFSLLSLNLFVRLLRPSAAEEWGPSEGPSGIARGPALAAAVLCYALACLSKETGVVLPGILAAHGVLFGGRRGESARLAAMRGLKLLAPFAVILLVYVVVRVAVLGTFSPSQGVLDGASPLRRLYTMGLVYFKYAELLVRPAVLQIDFYYRQGFLNPSQSTLQSTLGLALASGVAVLTLRWIRQALPLVRMESPACRSDEARFAAVQLAALSLLLCFFFPYSHLVQIGAVMAERFLFAPSLGVIFLVVFGADRWMRGRWASDSRRIALAVALVVPLAAAGASRSHERAREWRDDVRLWQAAVRDLPGDHRVHSNLATAYMDRGELEMARPALEVALALEPRDPMLRRNLLRLEDLEARAAAPERGRRRDDY